MRVAISWFTLDTPEGFSGAVSVEIMSGGVACRRTFLDLIDARKLNMNNHMDAGKEGRRIPFFVFAIIEGKKTEFSGICRVQVF
jgi:hypothetical protein